MFINMIKPTWRCLLHPRFVGCLCVSAPYRIMYTKITKKKYIPRHYAGRLLHTREQGNEKIKLLLRENKPFAIARYGYNELNGMACARSKKLRLTDTVNMSVCKGVFTGAGVFPMSEDVLLRFEDVMAEASTHLDMLFCFRSIMEDYYIKSCIPQNCDLYLSTGLEPYYFSEPWTKELKGKKVLVIHPFEETIHKQYDNRKQIWGDYELLPEFELITMKAVQSAAMEQTNYSTWFDALDAMYQQAVKIDFDVAILGCGAYGLPLATKLKLAGKQAIHLGGATQVLFGIMGSRWKNHPVVSRYINEYWSKPSITETPKQAKIVENACYW